jgi:hypothetical protein
MGIQSETWKVINPLETYRTWFESMGLTIVRERPTMSEVPNIFKTPIVMDRMQRLYKVNVDDLAYNFIDYTLTK